MEKYIENIKKFAEKHGLTYTLEGECGFGRECVGILKGDNYIDYNPTDRDCEYITGLYNEKLYDIVPPKAYHKHNCLAVLGRDEESIKQLSEWVDELEKLNCKITQFVTGYTGIEALLSGTHGHAININ